MALNIVDPTIERLVQRLAELTGESLTEAVTVALRERLAALERRAAASRLIESVESIQALVAALPDRDCRTPGGFPGYDGHGLPA